MLSLLVAELARSFGKRGEMQKGLATSATVSISKLNMDAAPYTDRDRFSNTFMGEGESGGTSDDHRAHSPAQEQFCRLIRHQQR